MGEVSGDNVKKDDVKCNFPNCTAGEAVVRQDRVLEKHADVLSGIKDLIQQTMSESNRNGKETVNLLRENKNLLIQSNVMAVEITNIRETMQEFTKDQKKVNDTLFDLMRKKVSKQEIVWVMGIISAIATGVFVLVK